MPGDGGDGSGGGGVAIRGGNIYWGRKGGTDFRRIVVIFAWVSIPHNLLWEFVDSSLGWNSLVCYAHYLSAFHDENVMSLAFSVLKELIEELRIRSCPVVFATFSAGSKACLNKVFQLIEGGCEARIHMHNYQLLKRCDSGHIYDSGPLDVTSDFGFRFSLHPSIAKVPEL